MASKKEMQLSDSLAHLKQALELYRRRDKGDPLPFLTVTKAFEVAVEYGWRLLKDKAENEGLDAPSPKAAVRAAAKLGVVSDPQAWFDCIEARNASVHDYFGIGETDFITLAEKYVGLVESLPV